MNVPALNDSFWLHNHFIGCTFFRPSGIVAACMLMFLPPGMTVLKLKMVSFMINYNQFMQVLVVTQWWIRIFDEVLTFLVSIENSNG